MKTNLEFHYRYGYKALRQRNTRFSHAIGSTELEFKEISSDEAPVVARVGQHVAQPSRGESRFTFKVDGSPREVRLINGRHFVELTSVADFLQLIEGEGIRKTLFGFADARLDKYALKNATFLSPRDLSSRQALQYIDYDAEERMAETLRLIAEDIIIVDGAVFEWTPEPVVHLDLREERVKSHINSAPFRHLMDETFRKKYGDRTWETVPYGKMYRESLTEAHCLFKEFDVSDAPFIEILDEYAFLFDGATYDTKKMITECLYSLSHKAANLPEDLLSAYYDLRDAMEEAGAQITPDLLRAAEKVATFESVFNTEDALYRTEMIEDLDLKAISGSHLESANGVNLIKDAAKNALRRWDLRPVHKFLSPNVGMHHYRSGTVYVREIFSEGAAAEILAGTGGSIHELRAAISRGERIVCAETELGQSVLAVQSDGTYKVISGVFLEDEALEAYLEHSKPENHLLNDVLVDLQESLIWN